MKAKEISHAHTKAKKDKKPLQNFAIQSLEANPILWDKEEIKIINLLKTTYKFGSDFDLHAHLSRVLIDIKSSKERERQKPSIKDTKQSLNLIRNQTIILKKSFSDKLLKSIVKITQESETLFNMLEITGFKHRKLIAQNSLGEYKIFHDTINLLKTVANDDSLLRLPEKLEHIKEGIGKALSTLSPLKRGRNKITLEKAIIHNLLYIYIDGTSKKAKSNINRITGEYYGEFYFFIMDVLILLRKKRMTMKLIEENKVIETEIRIKVHEKNTWGDYAREVIRDHYREEQENT